MTARNTFSLRAHATYQCRHAGACCTAGWRIPVEPPRQAALGTELLVPDERGVCRFYDEPSARCRVHRDLGAEMLPVSCRQFPRVSLSDDRGTFVTLSHFCPTAASLLFDDIPLEIDANPQAFPADFPFDSLDARGEWPPMVRPALMFDLASYSRWEAFVVSQFAKDVSVRAALSRIAEAVERLRGWAPERGAFDVFVGSALTEDMPEGDAAALYSAFAGDTAWTEIATMARKKDPSVVIDPMPLEEVTRWLGTGWTNASSVVRRYLAAKAFGSWCAYQAEGLRTQVAELYATETVLRQHAARAAAQARRPLDYAILLEAIRSSDWLLVHCVDRIELTKWLGGVERTP